MRRVYAVIVTLAVVFAGLALLSPSSAQQGAGVSVPTLDEFNALEARVAELEGRVDDHEGRVDDHEARLAALEADPDPTPDPDPDPTPDPDPDPTPDPDPDPTPDPDPDPGEITHGSQLTTADVGPSGSLTASGSIQTTHNGQVIRDVEVTGTIVVRHQDVLIKNVRVLVNDRYGVQVPLSLHSTATFRLEDSEVRGVGGDRSACVVHYGRWTMKRSLVTNCVDGLKMGSGHHVIESIITEPYHLPPGSHNDGIQSVGGSNSSVVRSRVDGPFRSQTSALLWQTNLAPISNVRLESNYFSGGGYTLYIKDKGNGHGRPSNMTVIDNIFEQGSWSFGPLNIDVGTGWTWQNNRTTTGVPLNI